MNADQFQKIFPLGSHLCREPMPPMPELKHDMEILKDQGFNLVKLQEHWMVDEPEEGQYDFSRYEELIEHAASLDMGVYLGLTCEQAPPWLYVKHPQCRMVGRNGQVVMYEASTTLPADGKPGPCYDHPGAMADQCRFITQLVKTLGRYENLVIWNTWQEVGYWSEGLVGQHTCYCGHTQEAYRTWLQTLFGDLDALNRKWNTRYADWKYVAPERGTQVRPVAQEHYWRYFMNDVQIANVLRHRAEAIRLADPLKRPVFAHMGAPQIGSGQEWTYARCQDFLGSSCYPPWFCTDHRDDDAAKPLDRYRSLHTEMWDSLALRFDYIRSCHPPGSPVWAAEFQGGPIWTGLHKGRVPTPADIQRWMLTAAGAGITALSFWVTRAEIMASEDNGYSLLDSTGDMTPRLAEAGRVGRAMNQHPDLFGAPTRQPSKVAILVDEWNHVFCSTLTQGKEHQPYAVRGWYRLLWDLDIPADFVEAGELREPYAQDYKVIIMPFPLSMSEATAEALAAYVHGGGTLISEACPGRINEAAFCNRGELSPAMRELLGVEQQTFTMVREPGNQSRWSPPERSWGEYLDEAMLTGIGELNGHELRANVYIETYKPTTASACLRYGDAVAGTVRDAGKGRAWLLGTFVGHSGTAYRNRQTHICVNAILAACHVHPEHDGPLSLRKRKTADKEAWFFTNTTQAPITEELDVSGWNHVEDLLGETMERTEDKVTLSVDSLGVRVLILTK